MNTRARRLVAAGTAAAIVAQALAACGPVNAPAQAGATPAAQSQALPVTTAKVDRQTIVTFANYGGSIQPKSLLQILPRTAGRVVKLPVDIGATVKAGDLLAELDHATNDAQVAQARANISSAQANLASAQARLATILAGPKPEDIAASEAQVDAARIKLQQVIAGARAEDIRSAEATIASAQTRLDVAQSGGRIEDVLAAQAQLDSAKNRLAQVQAAGRSEDLRAAEASLASTKARLQALVNPRAEDVQSARTAVDQAQTRLNQALDFGTGTGITAKPRPEDIANAQLAVQNAQSAYDKALTDTSIVGKTGGPTTAQAADLAVKQALANLQIAQNNLAKLQQQGPTDWDIRLLQEALVTAQANYEKLVRPSATDIAVAQANVDSAQANLDKLKNVTPFDIEAAVQSVNQAQANLDKARNPDPSNVAQLQSTLESAVANLEKLKNPSPFDIDAARASLAQAEAQLASRKNQFSDQDRKGAEASVAQAQAAVEQQQAALAIQQANQNEAFVVAPFDGVISDRPVTEGSVVSTNTSLMTLISREVEILLNVEEVHIPKFQENAPATFTVTALPGQTFKGQVTSVFPTGDARSRTFTVKVRPDDQSGKLRAGMFAQLSVELERHENVPAIPKDAIVTRNDKPIAFAVVDGTASLRQLELGLADDRRVEVTKGLQAGEDVVTSGQTTLRDKDAVRVQPAGQRPAGAAGAPGQPGAAGQAGGQPGQAPQGTQGAAGAQGAANQPGGAGAQQQGQRPQGAQGAQGAQGGQPAQQGQAPAGAQGQQGQRPAGTPGAQGTPQAGQRPQG